MNSVTNREEQIQRFESDISDLVDNAEIHIDRHLEAGQLSFYKDVRSFIVRTVLKNSHKNYPIFPFSEFEANRIAVVAGYENVIGNYKTGLNLIGKHQYTPEYLTTLSLRKHK